MVETFTTHITPYGLDRNVFLYLPDDWQTSADSTRFSICSTGTTVL